jgi:hypothetical protein
MDCLPLSGDDLNRQGLNLQAELLAGVHNRSIVYLVSLACRSPVKGAASLTLMLLARELAAFSLARV